MEIKVTDMDIVDANVCFAREYLTKARVTKDKERLLKLLVLSNNAVANAIKQIDSNIILTNIKDKCPSVKNKA